MFSYITEPDWPVSLKKAECVKKILYLKIPFEEQVVEVDCQKEKSTITVEYIQNGQFSCRRKQIAVGYHSPICFQE